MTGDGIEVNVLITVGTGDSGGILVVEMFSW